MKTHSSFSVQERSAKKSFSSVFVCLMASIGLTLCGSISLFRLSMLHDGLKSDSLSGKLAVRLDKNQSDDPSTCRRAKKPNSTSAPTRSIEILRAAFLTAQNTKCPIKQNLAFHACLSGLSPEAAANILSSMNLEELDGIASQHLFHLWSNANPQNALEWACGLDVFETRNVLIDMAAARWASQDLKSAEHWVRSIPVGDARTELANAIIEGAISMSPVQALRLAGDLLPEGISTNKLIIQASGEWAVLDRDSAVAWARKITDISLRQEVLESMAILSSSQDFRAAIDIALYDMATGDQQDRVIASVVQLWSQEEPVLVASWIRQFSDDRLGQEAAEILINQWVISDPKASGDWLSSLPPSRFRNVGVISYARALRHADASMANHWEAKLLSDL